MAHIADLMVEKTNSIGLNNHIARELSPHSPHDAATETPPTDEKEKYVWRMHQPAEPRKYQLFPTKDKLSIAAGQKNGEGETTQSTGQNGTNEKDRSTLGSALRLKPKEQTLIRRRKVSVPELGPMTTVQEIAMDSPTIPGRPPLHERSISAPGNSWRQHVFGESMLSCISGPALDENAEMAILDNGNSPAQANPTTIPPSNPQTANNSRSESPKQQPLSPKSLAPLVIPQTSQSQPLRLLQKNSAPRLRSGSTPPEVPPKSARMTEGSPHRRASPFTPLSSTSNLLSSTSSTAPRSGTPTPTPTPLSTLPVSTPEGRSSPKPWSATTNTHSPSTTTNSHSRNQSDVPNSARTLPLGHRRGDSEGASSIMDRGRPKKRSDTSPAPIIIPQTLSKSRRSPSTEEQKAFEHLPTGIRATDAPSLLSPAEIEVLRKQAVGQASRFQVLSSKDVETLSRELRALDERCEYLRKTHRSLRSGRRNLHDRICTYLRSPRVARFSHESMLKQEEALSELDSSIDDWVSKLEQAENRRTRVRQKLLEHVAAALTIQPVAEVERRENEHEHERMHMHIVTQMVKGEMNTPPRSPTKASSPERLERVVEEVRVASPETMVRSSRNGRDVESIRIYADSDVYALLADVEEEINRMGEQGEADRVLAEAEKEQKKDDTIQAGITLNAVAFEGMLAHSRSYQNIRTPTPEFV